MTPEREEPPSSPGGSPTTHIDCRDYRPGDDPLEVVIDATPAERLRWALIEQGHDPALFDLTDDDTRPATVVVRASLRAAARGLTAVWWDEETGKAAGFVAGTADNLREAIAVLEALTPPLIHI